MNALIARHRGKLFIVCAIIFSAYWSWFFDNTGNPIDVILATLIFLVAPVALYAAAFQKLSGWGRFARAYRDCTTD
jgi:hypothetical protein